jgi:predicted esterase
MTHHQTAPLTHGGAAPDRARYGLVLVHGRGASAGDILGLGAALALPDLALVAPQAAGHSWWPTSFLAASPMMEPHVQSGFAAIDAAISTLEDGGLPRAQIALAGFSQGGCLALEYAARRGGLMAAFGLAAGLVGTSDAPGEPRADLYGHTPKAFDYTADLTNMPTYIAVHEQDPHIPLARARDSAAAFERLGAPTTLHVTPGPGHGITETDIASLRAAFNRP